MMGAGRLSHTGAVTCDGYKFFPFFCCLCCQFGSVQAMLALRFAMCLMMGPCGILSYICSLPKLRFIFYFFLLTLLFLIRFFRLLPSCFHYTVFCKCFYVSIFYSIALPTIFYVGIVAWCSFYCSILLSNPSFSIEIQIHLNVLGIIPGPADLRGYRESNARWPGGTFT